MCSERKVIRMKLLESIHSPKDLKCLELPMLKVLAHEIRQDLVKVTSVNGGHLAPNLGVVELTLALHYIYNTPDDKIVWDVGHQAYVHKMLTGRAKDFSTIRTFGGLAGFPKRSESVHDAFGTGHSSTSISAALGLALARDLKKEKHEVVAVIGDGAMTGGMAFEALNYTGHLQTKLTVILNDNEMSIAHNVGAMSEYLNRVRVDPSYTKTKEDVEILLKKIPAIGDKMIKIADRLKDSLKYLLVPGTLFEELGFKYFGPINGHDIPALINVLENAKLINKPVLIHVITQKGKGYLPAEQNPDVFHGVGAFDIKTSQAINRKTQPTYTDIFGDTMIKLGATNEKIVGITAAMGLGTGISKFAEKFPDRAFDVGIAEQNAVTMAAGLALEGYTPVVAIYSTFLQRAYDQILHDVCLQNAPVVFALDRAGLVGDDGPTHHGVFDISYLGHIPNMVLMSPKDENELQHMLYSATQYQKPVAIRYPRGSGVGVALDTDYHFIPLGEAELLQSGQEVAFLAYGPMVSVAKEVAQLLAKEDGIEATIINARFAKPLDKALILANEHQHTLYVTLEEHALIGGFGSGVLALFNEEGLDGRKILRIGLEDEFVVHGSTERLKELAGLTSEAIYQKVKQRLKQNNKG